MRKKMMTTTVATLSIIHEKYSENDLMVMVGWYAFSFTTYVCVRADVCVCVCLRVCECGMWKIYFEVYQAFGPLTCIVLDWCSGPFTVHMNYINEFSMFPLKCTQKYIQHNLSENFAVRKLNLLCST